MPLEDFCEKYKGSLVFVLPIEGFGWSRISSGMPPTQSGDWIEPPSPFYARITEFHSFHGKIKAGIAMIEEQHHPLDNQWVAFCIRDGGGEWVHNLTTNPASYNVRIGNEKPSIQIDPEKLSMPEWMQFGSSLILSGEGYILDSRTTLEEVFKRIKSKR